MTEHEALDFINDLVNYDSNGAKEVFFAAIDGAIARIVLSNGLDDEDAHKIIEGWFYEHKAQRYRAKLSEKLRKLNEKTNYEA